MSVSINSNNQVVLPNANDVTWVANDSEVEVSNNNYGRVLESKTVGNEYVVKTEHGTLTFGAPRLEEAKRTFSDFEISQTNFSDIKGFSWLELAEVVMEAEKLRRKENREARLTERDNAMQQSLNAAKKLKDAANVTLGMGIASGIIGGVTGGIGMAGGMKSFGKSFKALKLNTKAAKLDNDLAVNTKDLASTRKQLKQMKADGKQGTPEFKALKDKETRLQKEQNDLFGKLDSQVSDSSKSIAKSEKKLKKTQSEIADTQEQLNKLPLDTKKADFDKLDAKLTKLETKEADIKQDVAIQRDHVNDLNQTKSKATELSKAGDNVDHDANVAKADQWSTDSGGKVKELDGQLNQIQAEAQSGTQVLNALQMLGGSARGGLDTGSQYNETNARADAQELDAAATKAKAAEEEANADFQDSNRAIQAFKDCWERCEDSRNQTRQNLANWTV